MEKKPAYVPSGDGKTNPRFRKQKRKVCQFCADKTVEIDYKESLRLKKWTTDKGKILPRRQTGTCAKHQRELTNSIKRARNMALLPFKAE